MGIPKEHLSLAGEYAVASELCRRGIYAQLTLGTRKKVDILADTGTMMFRVEVKAKQIDKWACRGIYDENDFLIFVDYQDKKDEDRPDFYILNNSEWDRFVKQNYGDQIDKEELRYNPDDKKCPILWPSKKEEGRTYKNVDVKPKQIAQHKEGEGWKKIEALLNKKG